MKMYVMTIDDRSEFCQYLTDRLPDVILIKDQKRDAMDTFLRMMDAAGEEPGLFMEDDIILTRNFEEKVNKVVNQNPNAVIQFFSLRKKDLLLGSRADMHFGMNQCFYLPATYARKIKEFYPHWPGKETDPVGYDTMMRYWLQRRKEHYLLHVPSLVQHRVAKSMIHKSRSSKRQSPSFVDPWE